MNNVIWKWNMHQFIQMIVAIILNKFDCFIVIEGGTGIGKSSFAWEVAFAVSKEFRRLFSLNENTITYYYERIGKEQGLTPEEFVAKILELKQKKAYHFNPYRDLVYSQDAMQEFLASWNRIAIPDELINVLFNREFFSQKQKDIVKMVNMYRDHENIILSCVPMFSSLDNQIRNLTKIKIIIKKRGLAMVHLPNKTIYSKDKWDSLVNEKIERVWIMKKIQNPNYSKLTTFRGFLKFHPMSQAHAKIYQDIKNKKRSTILKEEMGIDIKDSKDVIELLVDRLLKGGIKNMQMIEGVAFANGLGLDQLRGKIRKILVEREVNPTISHYFYDKRAKNEADDNSISITRT